MYKKILFAHHTLFHTIIHFSFSGGTAEMDRRGAILHAVMKGDPPSACLPKYTSTKKKSDSDACRGVQSRESVRRFESHSSYYGIRRECDGCCAAKVQHGTQQRYFFNIFYSFLFATEAVQQRFSTGPNKCSLRLHTLVA